jgi:hypothetical protein
MYLFLLLLTHVGQSYLAYGLCSLRGRPWCTKTILKESRFSRQTHTRQDPFSRHTSALDAPSMIAAPKNMSLTSIEFYRTRVAIALTAENRAGFSQSFPTMRAPSIGVPASVPNDVTPKVIAIRSL